MPKKINLIPAEMTVSPKIIKTINLINKITILGALVLVLTIISIIVFYLFNQLELKKNELSIESLRQEINSLEKSEQKLILAKNKIEKISLIKSKKTALANILNLENLNINFAQTIIEPSKLEVISNLEKASDLIPLLGPIYNLEQFKNINLISLVLKMSTGLTVDLVFEN